uniref:Probable RNA-binding protein 18 n=1 Tax=Eptatretus burgeri TaxID=7764 RepID=A0A8C4QG73_EPTBU
MDKKREASQLAIDSAAVLSEGCRHDGHRLWIGNLDLRLSEYHLLRLLKRIGTVRQFDFLFHRSGPLEGQPRGYCFVNFSSKQEAERAIEKLNGKLALSRPLVVRWAHAQQQPTYERQREPNLPSSLEPSATETEPPCASSLTRTCSENQFGETKGRRKNSCPCFETRLWIVFMDEHNYA